MRQPPPLRPRACGRRRGGDLRGVLSERAHVESIDMKHRFGAACDSRTPAQQEEGRMCRSSVLALFAIAAMSVGASSDPSMAQSSPRVERGRTFARVNCSMCHSIDKVSPSPLAIAPPFRTLHERYSVETLEEALAEGIITGHPNMPEFQLAPDQVGDVIAFLKNLER